MIYKEINFCGIFLAPLLLYLLVAGAIYFPLHRFWDRIEIQRWVWNRPVFEAALFLILLGAIAYFL
ncbi:MAG TPA: DUF1656 domain-containing protein [Verrucomicrobiae bacterium]|nr:DUF1656 domain-containing protein [Verrucomicrobiae bacterium]